MFFRPDAAKLLAALKESVGSLESYRAIKNKLARLGSRNPAALLQQLTMENADTIGTAIRGSGETGLAMLRRMIVAPHTPQTYAALRALWEFEEDAASEVDLLTGLLEDRDEEIRHLATHALGRIGEPALPAGAALLQLAQHGTESEKVSALWGLSRMGYDPMILEQVCYDLLKSDSESRNVKGAAISALEKIGRDPSSCFTAIVEYIEATGKGDLVSSVLKLLERCDLTSGASRRRAAQSVESLVKVPVVQGAQTLQTLWRIDPGNALVRQRVEEDLRSDDYKMESACDVICVMKEAGAQFVPLLLVKLKQHQEYWDFCWAAVDALNQIGPAAISAKPMLEEMRAHSSGLVKVRVECAIASIEGRPVPDTDNS